MDHEKNQSRETGIGVWESLMSQMEEAGGFFGGMFRSFKVFVKNYFWSLLILGLIGAMIAGGSWWLKPRYFRAEMTVSYVHYEKKIYADMLEKLDMLIQAGDAATISYLLGLQEDEVEGIYYIKSFNIRKEPLVEDLSTEKIPFYVVVGVQDPDILPVLQQAIVDYLNNTDFIQSRLDFMYKKTVEELDFLEHRLAVADSLSKMYIIRNESMNDEKAITRKELLDESMAIYARIQEVRGMQTFNLNIEVLDGFIALETKAGKGLLNFILLGFFAGIALRTILLLFR